MAPFRTVYLALLGACAQYHVLGAWEPLCTESAVQANLATNMQSTLPDLTVYAITKESSSKLYRIQLPAMTHTLIGSIGYELVNLVFDRSGTNLYGLTSNGGSCERCLIRVSQTTGSGTSLGQVQRSGSRTTLVVPAAFAFLSSDTEFVFADEYNSDQFYSASISDLSTNRLGSVRPEISTYAHSFKFIDDSTLFVANGDGGILKIAISGGSITKAKVQEKVNDCGFSLPSDGDPMSRGTAGVGYADGTWVHYGISHDYGTSASDLVATAIHFDPSGEKRSSIVSVYPSLPVPKLWYFASPPMLAPTSTATTSTATTSTAT
eukprot:CAMPEP_0197871520 /NCGR_PEP_ID=MMETSP1439-20131203/1896_1 /TAXON_ID=66791 /ORGANISM="Gonyaulax spinifera, Strain CCMP409" /LENGTH=320 /DNA_ID=CAMNT_0043490459 /DNA_START=59 /DNA_END=1018 /DNA_ORIENTATION=+